MDQMRRASPTHRLRVRTERGEPIEAGGRMLVPVARVVSFAGGRGTVGGLRISGSAVGLARITPAAVLDITAGETRRIPIYDATGARLRWLGGAALAILLFFTAFRRLARYL